MPPTPAGCFRLISFYSKARPYTRAIDRSTERAVPVASCYGLDVVLPWPSSCFSSSALVLLSLLSTPLGPSFCENETRLGIRETGEHG